MSDQPERAESIEQVEAERIGQGRFRADEVCVRLGISSEILELCLRWEVIEPSQAEEGEALFDEAAMDRIRSGVRLHHDLGINWPGVAVILDLLARIDALEREMELRFQQLDWRS
jgi:chaperone modulatory protein CbpM